MSLLFKYYEARKHENTLKNKYSQPFKYKNIFKIHLLLV